MLSPRSGERQVSVANEAQQIDDEPAPSDPSRYLGPAQVVRGRPGAQGAEVLVRLPSGQERGARLALAYGYVPEPGDEVVILADAHGCYLIGVDRTGGEIHLELPGDAHVHAGGELSLSGDRGVELSGPSLLLRAERLRVIAETLTQTSSRYLQRVRDILTVHAGEKREVIDGELATRADRATLIGRATVTLNGKEIHLG